MSVKKGDKIKVEYTGSLEDGTVFDSTDKQGGQPLKFEVGSGQLIKGFDETVIGMKKGDEKEVKLSPEKAYGDNNPEMIKEVPKEQMPQGQKIKEGMVLGLALPNGQQMPAKVIKVGNKTVSIDLNHPLAGKTLIFKIKVVGIN